MNEYWEVLDPFGKKIANTGIEYDAINLCLMRGHGYTYRKVKFIMDQVIDVTSTTDKQLPGQQGLPPSKIKIDRKKEEYNQYLPEGQEKPFGFH